MRFGTFLEFSCPDGTTTEDSYRQALDHVDQAEAIGLDIIDVAEFHFTPNRVVSSPIALAAAIAGRTKRVRVGTSVLVLPLGNPIRMAEEVATIDQLSQGRFEFGVGRSGFQVAYAGYGIPYEQSSPRFWEALDVITKAFTLERFSHEGTFYSYSDVCLIPKPYQSPHPPIRIAATSDETFPVIGKAGHSLLVGLRSFPLPRVSNQVKAYHDAWSESGNVGIPDVSLRVPVYVAETKDEAIHQPEESFMRQFRRLATQYTSSAAESGARPVEQRDDRGAGLSATSWEDARREKVIVGTPEMIIDQIREFKEVLGLTEIVAEFNAGELIPPDKVARSLRLFGEQVVPAFR